MLQKEYSAYFLKSAAGVLLAIFCLFAKPFGSIAQPLISADNMALGGGGTAFVSGFEASFLNPANLAIPSHEGRLHIGLGHMGLSYQPVLSATSANTQLSNFKSSFYPYTAGSHLITGEQRTLLLAENYGDNGVRSQHLNRADLIIGGFLLQKGDEAYSFAIRSRMGSRIETGRGWYSYEFQDNSDEDRIRDFTLNQQKQQLYEFSFGYGREFTIINGLIPRLSKLYVGIAPKVVISGMYHDMEYDARYSITDTEEIIYNSDFSFRSTGNFSRASTSYMSTSDVEQAISGTLDREVATKSGGYGIGFDFGFTYLVPLGGELPTEKAEREHAEVNKSLRISFSITDIGAVRYYDQPLQLTAGQDSLQTSQQEITQTMFTGAGGQYLAYFDEVSSFSNPFLSPDTESRSGFIQMLPTSINTGLLFELNRLKLISDLTLGLNNTAFTTTKLAVHLGMELRPHLQIPLCLGTKIAAGAPVNVGFGTGFESRHWDFKVGTQIIMRSQALTTEITGGAFAGLQLHF